MRRESYQQFAIVAADSAQSLTEQLNAKLVELKDKHPQVSFEGLIARISYTEDVVILEDLCDEYEHVGVDLSCANCPFFGPRRKANGEEDKRAKWGECPCAPYGKTSRESKVCNRLFEMLNRGEVVLCIAEKED